MARVIGYVKSLEHGTFFVKDEKGNIRQLKAGEAIHEGELVYGSKSNPSNAQIIIDVTLQGAGDLVIAGNGALNFDTSLLKGIFSHDDAVVYVNSVKDALALAGGNITNVETDLRDGQPTNGDDETAAGQTLSNQEHASDTFSDRDGLIKDVRTLLNFTGNDVAEPLVETRPFRPVVVEETPILAIPTPSTAPTISINDVTVNEDAGTMSFTVTLNHATTAPVTFNYASSNNSPLSAEAGKDYSAVSGAGSIATGATTTTITVPISDDFLKEGNETFLMNLSNLSANVASSGNDLQGVGTITDAGSITPPTPEVPTTSDTVYIRLVNSDTVTETGGDGALNHRIELVDNNGNLVTVPTGGSVTVTLVYNADTTSSGDYSAARTTSVTIPAGSNGVNISNAILNDAIYEGNEGYTLTIGTVTQSGDKFEAIAQHSTVNTVTGTITDSEDLPKVSSVVGDTVLEGASNTFTVTLSNASTTSTSVNLSLTSGTATVGTDTGTVYNVSYNGGTSWTTLSGSSATVPAGTTTFLVRVATTADFVNEGTETYTLTATANTVSGNGTGSILNVNHAPTPIADVRTTPEDTPVSGNVLTNDTDPDSGTTLSVTQFVVNGTTYTVGSTATIVGVGTLAIGSNGTYTFTPVANWNGTVPQVTYTVSDGALTATSTLNITVTPVNDAPTSTNDAITILEDMNNTTNVYTVSINDFGTYSDVDNNSLVSVRIDSLPTNGTLYLNGTAVSAGTVIPVASITGGLLTFDPINHTDADSSFTFSVNDGTIWSTSSYTTTVTINAVADTPTALISGTGVVTQTITIANVTTTANGFTISALNPNGSVGTISTHTTPDGFGVAGTSSGDTTEIGYLDGTGSEKLVVSLNNAVSSVDVSFAWKHSYGVGETALVEFYNNGVLVGTRTYNGGSDAIDPAITLQPSGGGVFNEIRFSAMGSGDDYLIHSISFEKTSNSTTTITTDDNRSVDLDASSALVDTDGSESLVTTISGLPAGYTLTDGTHTFTATSGSTVANVTGWNLTALSLDVPTVTAQTTVTLTITATATESSNGSNASASDTIDIIVMPHNDAPTFTTTTITAAVSEEGLAGGLVDTTGTSDTTNATVVAGTFNISDSDSPSVSVSLSAPTTVLTSNGTALTWTGSGTGTLVATANGSTVMTVTIDNSGNYSVNLSGPLDHSTTGVEDVLAVSFGVSASDGSAISTGTLTVNIEDDAPVTSTQTNSINVAQIDTNVMVILDVSGSMTSGSVDRLAAAKTAITNLINAYDGYGDVAVKLVTFSTTAADRYGVWMTASDAIALLTSITSGGMTNYDAALAQAMDGWKTAGKLTTESGHTVQNVVYFMSDGQPNENDGNTSVLANNANGTSGGADAGIQTTEETTWTTFLNNSDIKAYALGIGDGLTTADMAYLDPIAYNGVTGANDSSLAILVPDVSQLTQVLLSTIDPIATGNVLTSATPGAVGADGGHVSVITVGTGSGMSTFTWNTLTNTVSSTGSTTNTATFNSTTHALSVTTAQGGLYVIDLDSGDYTYTPPMSVSGTITEVFGFTLLDNDGDSSSGQITLNVSVNPGTASTTGTSNPDAALSGSINDDIMSGLAGNDTISGNAGNDWISGGTGTDVLNGGDGNDKLDGGAGTDTLNGGAGNDLLISDLQTDSATGTTLSGDTGLGKVDGGTGFDTFMMLNDASAINFAALDSTNNPIKNMEVIDLGANGTADNHQLTNIRLQDVIDMTDTNNDLYILGDNGDAVSLDTRTGQVWSLSGTSTETINGQQHTFNVYSNSGDSTVTLKVEDSVTVSIV